MSLVLGFAFVYTVAAGLNYDINYWKFDCHESSKVVEITKAQHRTVWVELANGTELELNQPRNVYPGKDYCTSGERVRNDVELSWWMLPVKMFE